MNSSQRKGFEQGRAGFHPPRAPPHHWLLQSWKQTLLSKDARAENAANPRGAGGSHPKVPRCTQPLPRGDEGLLTCQASSCCERFTFCWMASSSWLLRDIMSILHLASSTSTAFFLGGERETGAWDFYHFYFFFYKGSVQHILDEKSTISFAGKFANPKLFISVVFWTSYSSSEWNRTVDIVTI